MESKTIWEGLLAASYMAPSSTDDFTPGQAVQLDKQCKKLLETPDFALLKDESNEKLTDIVKRMYSFLRFKMAEVEQGKKELALANDEIRNQQTILDAVENSQIYMNELSSLQREIEELNDRAVMARRQVQKAESESERTKSKVKELERVVEEAKDREQDLDSLVTKLQKDLDQQRRGRSNTGDSGESHSTIREKNKEITRLLDDLKAGNEENGKLRDDLMEVTEELEITVTALENAGKETEMLRKAIGDADKECSQLNEERNALRFQLDEIARQLDMKDSVEANVMRNLQQQLSTWRDLIANYKKSSKEKDDLIANLKQDLDLLQGEIKYSDINSLREQLKEEQQKNADLAISLEKAKEDFQMLSVDWEHMKSAKDSTDMRKKLVNKIKSTVSEMQQSKAKKQVEDDSDYVKDKLRLLESELTEKQDEILAQRQRMDQYERGYGLNDAISEIRDLKLQVGVRDDDILRLAAQVNALSGQLDDVIEINEILEKTGTVDSKDMERLRAARTSEAEKLKTLNARLQEECDEMEEERIQLKRDIRDLISRQPVENGLLSGLSEPQRASVIEYVEDIKSKRRKFRHVSTSDSDPLAKMSDDLQKLYQELKLSTKEREEMAGKYDKLHKKYKKMQKMLENASSPSSESPTIEHRGFHNNDETSGLASLIKTNASLSTKVSQLQEALDNITSELVAEKKNADDMKQVLLNVQQSVEMEANAPPRWFEVLLKSILEKTNGQKVKENSNVWVSTITEQFMSSLAELETKDESLTQVRDELALLKGEKEKLGIDLECAQEQAKVLTRVKEEEGKQMTDMIDKLERHTSDLQEELKIMKTNYTQILDENENIQLQREVNICRLKEGIYKRDINLATLQIDQLKSEITRSSQMMIQIDETCRKTISHLRATIREQAVNLEKVQTQLENSVPLKNYSHISVEFERLSILHQDLVSKYESFAHQSVLSIDLSQKVRRLEDENIELKSQIQNSHPVTDFTKLPAGDQAVKLRQMEIDLNTHKNKLQMMEQKFAAFVNQEKELTRLYQESQDRFSAVQDELVKLQTENVQAHNMLLYYIPRDEHESVVSENFELKSELVKSKNDCESYQSQTTTALNQIRDVSSHNAEYEIEIKTLKESLSSLNKFEKDDLVTKLTHQVVTCEQKELRLKKDLEGEQQRCRSIQDLLVETQSMLKEREGTLWKRRFEYKSKLVYLIDQYTKWRATFGAAAGKNVSSEQSLWTIHKLMEQIDDLKEELTSLKSEQVENKDTSQGINAEVMQMISKHPQSQKKVFKRLVEWKDKVLVANKQLKYALRELEISKAEKGRSDKWLETYSARVSELEQKLLHSESQFESTRLLWEKRELDLETRLLEFEEDRDKLFQVATGSLVSLASLTSNHPDKLHQEYLAEYPDPKWTVAKQLEFCFRGIKGKSQALAAQTIEVKKLREDLVSSNNQNAALQDEVIQLHKDMEAYKRMKLSSHAVEEYIETANQPDELVRLKGFEKTARNTIESLKNQIGFKNEQIQRYQDRLMSIENDFEKEKRNLAKELSVAKIKAIEESDRMREAMVQKQRQSQKELMVDGKEFTIDDLKNAIINKEGDVINLKVELSKLRREMSANMTDSSLLLQEVDHLKVSLGQMQTQLQEREEQLNQKTEEVSSLKTNLNVIRTKLRIAQSSLKNTDQTKAKSIQVLKSQSQSLKQALNAVMPETSKKSES